LVGGILPDNGLVINPSSCDFDEVTVGSSKRLHFTLANTNNAPLSIDSFGPINGCTDIEVIGPIPPLPLVLAAGETAPLGFLYSPSQVNGCAREYEFGTDDPDPNNRTVALECTGQGIEPPFEPNVSISLTPITYVVPKGGDIVFNVEATNNDTENQQAVDYLVNISRPNGGVSPLFGPLRVVLAANQTILVEEIYPIPMTFPSAENYRLNAFLGDFPSSTVFDQDSFQFSVP
jgi:hypothetical protein